VSVKPIRLFGDPVLRTPAEPVRDFDAELRRLVKDLTDTMLDAPGLGLAAPQIGVGLRVFTYHVDSDEPGHLINPSLDLSDEQDEDDEGCLSFPGLAYPVTRAYGVVAKGFNMYGDPVTIQGSADVFDAFAVFKQAGTRRLPVLEEDELAGIISVDDLLVSLVGEFAAVLTPVAKELVHPS